MKDESLAPVLSGYDEFVRDLKKRITDARIRAGLAANRELVMLLLAGRQRHSD